MATFDPQDGAERGVTAPPYMDSTILLDSASVAECAIVQYALGAGRREVGLGEIHNQLRESLRL